MRYLQLREREAEHYAEALDMVNGAESRTPGAASETGDMGRAGLSAPSAAPAREAPRPGKSRVFDGIEFMRVLAQGFLMGSTSSESWNDGRPVTRVRISRGSWLGKYEVRIEIIGLAG